MSPTREDIPVDSIRFLLTSPDLSLDQRYDNFNTLYDDPDFNALMTDEFSESYLGYLNAEAVLQGENLGDLYN